MRPGRTAGIGRLSVIATRSRRHVGMPPYKARRTCSGNRGRFGRIYNPPLQAHTPPFADVGSCLIKRQLPAKCTTPVQELCILRRLRAGYWTRKGLKAAPFTLSPPSFCASFRAVSILRQPRAAPPELAGFRSSRPGHGGMRACRPTPAAAGGLPCTQKLAGRCGHRPLR